MPALQQMVDAIRAGYRDSFFADSGPFARSLFPKSMEFFTATKDYQNVNTFGSNRSSKSFSATFANSCWLMGGYPGWWPGRVFAKPIRSWMAGETGTLVRNNLQRYLIGEKGSEGQGCLIPGNLIQHVSYNGKPEGFAERAIINSKHGGQSVVEFKSYDQGSVRFASDTIDTAIFDEEPPPGIYTEMTVRTATTRGIVCGGFTALKGITPLIEHLAPEFAGGERKDPKETGIYNVVIGFADIPKTVLSDDARKRIIQNSLPHEVGPRTTGIPSIGSGMVYPISEEDFVIPDIPIPDHWPRLFAIDPGFKAPTAISFYAYDADSDAIYQIGEYYVKGQPVAVHVDAIHRHGKWMPGIIDYAGGNITDGKGVVKEYRIACENPLINANKSLSVGHMGVWDRLQTQRWFVFESLRHSRYEFRQYHRDEKGRIADTPRHIMDTWRYAETGIQHAKQRPHGFQFNGESMRAYQPQQPQQTVSLMDGIF